MHLMAPLIEPLIEAAHAGGAVARRYFGEALDIEEKSHASDYRTRADTESEQAILGVIDQAFPESSLYSEEIGLIDRRSRYTVVIDPLDGSNNFVLGIPNFTVSIAVMDGDQSILGVIYNPILETTYHAEKGKGAFRDATTIHVNDESDIRRATVSYTCGYINDADYAENVRRSLTHMGVKRLTAFWSPAYDYCLLASGKLEGVINNANDLYDFAAGKLIVREAGGTITGFDGTPQPDTNTVFIASNGPAIHDHLLQAV